MILTSKTYEIGKSYHPPGNMPRGAPAPDEDKPAAIMPVDRVTLSKYALETPSQGPKANPASGERKLSTEEQEVVNNLKQRDSEVKAHEQAHMASGSGVASGGASYQYQTGPDGKMYAIGGEVQIDVSAEGSPEGTIRKMQQIQAAALAPAQPSGTDRAVAAQAAQVEAMARLEKTQKTEKDTTSIPAEGELSETESPAEALDLMEQIGGHVDIMA